MLKTQSVSDAPPPITQEIAQAIAALEARSTSYTDNASQTVAVGEVIRSLGLDMTPEDVLAEVQAQRARHGKRLRPLPLWKWRLLGLMIPGALMILWALAEAMTGPQDTPPPAIVGYAPATVEPSPPAHLSIAPETLVQDSAGRVPTVRTWAEIPENHPVQCLLTERGFGFSQGVTASPGESFWTVVKHGGKPYLRCWTVSMSAQAMHQVSNSRGIALFSRPAAAFNTTQALVPLTLALDNFTALQADVIGENGTFEAFHVNRVQLDSHAYEKWTP